MEVVAHFFRRCRHWLFLRELFKEFQMKIVSWLAHVWQFDGFTMNFCLTDTMEREFVRDELPTLLPRCVFPDVVVKTAYLMKIFAEHGYFLSMPHPIVSFWTAVSRLMNNAKVLAPMTSLALPLLSQALKPVRDVDELGFDRHLASLAEQNAEAFEKLQNTDEQLAMYQQFLANLQRKGAESDETFDKRVKSRWKLVLFTTSNPKHCARSW